MSASMNLMGLVTQLQNMEGAISSVIMESALKLASLTSASIFIVIETEEARRFTGSPHLIDTYLQRNLTPSVRDLQIDVDLNTQIIHEHPPQPHHHHHLGQFSSQYHMTPGGGGGNDASSTNDLALSPQSLSMMSQSSSSRGNKTNMKRHVASLSGGGGGADTSFPSSSPKRRKSVVDPSSSSPSLVKMEDQKPTLAIDGSATAELISSTRTLNASSLDESNDQTISDDDSDIEVLESVTLMEESYAMNSSSNVPSSVVSSMSNLPVDRNRESGGGGGGNPGFVPVDVSQNQMKIEALRSIEDPLLAFQKGTAEARLCSSVFYDFGRGLIEKCPFALDIKNHVTKDFLHQNVNEFIKNFPNLQLDHPQSPVYECRVSVGKGIKLTPEAFLRMNARAGFTAAAKKAAKLNSCFSSNV